MKYIKLFEQVDWDDPFGEDVYVESDLDKYRKIVVEMGCFYDISNATSQYFMFSINYPGLKKQCDFAIAKRSFSGDYYLLETLMPYRTIDLNEVTKECVWEAVSKICESGK